MFIICSHKTASVALMNQEYYIPRYQPHIDFGVIVGEIIHLTAEFIL